MSTRYELIYTSMTFLKRGLGTILGKIKLKFGHHDAAEVREAVAAAAGAGKAAFPALLEEKLDARVRTLSGGQRRLLQVSR